MHFSLILFTIVMFAATALAQLPPGFFGGFAGNSFSGFNAAQQARVPTPGNGRASTGNRPEGPILFPPSPESRDTSGVVVGASGYGFIPPGVASIVQQARGSSSPFSASFSQPFPSSNFFNI